MDEFAQFDIAIVGGGLAGGLAASALGASGFSCALIDANDPDRMRSAEFDGRTSAISYASARVFKNLGIWDGVSKNAEPIRDILVTDGIAANRFDKGNCSLFSLHFDSAELGDDMPLGWIVENRHLRNAIYDQISHETNVEVFAPARHGSTRHGQGGATVSLKNGRSLSAKLIIAADGRSSGLRAEANIKTNQWRYDQTGIVVTVAHQHPHKGVAHEYFLMSGPFAILPMTGNRSSLVWTESSSAAPAYMALDDTAFVHEIKNRFGDFLGDLEVEGPRWSYPLAFTLAQNFIAPRLALIGDAAHAIHPIAGQGYNLGVKDIAALTDVLVDARKVGLDIGAMTVLQNYERWRRFDSATLAMSCDVLVRLFSNDIAPLRLARDIGMSAVGKISPLRKTFMRQAGADLGTLPSLMAADVQY